MTATNRAFTTLAAAPPLASDPPIQDLVPYSRYEQGIISETAGQLASEELLVVRIGGKKSFSMGRTPGNDMNLIAGRLFAQGLIRTPSDIRNISLTAYQTDVVAEIELAPVNLIRPEVKGVCGQGAVKARDLCELKCLFEKRQSLYHSTRATHAAALFSLDGLLLAFGEDVGRHNAFDKAIGQAFNENNLARVDIAVLSSRLALNLVEKASKAGIGILCGFSVATSSALKFARARDITLVGRLREDAMNIYTNRWRVE